mgnify:CR=1 FL=1
MPFLPQLDVLGKGLRYDEASSTLTYRVKEKPESSWRVFYADWLQAMSDFKAVGFERCQRQMFIGFLNKFPKPERAKFMDQKAMYDGALRKPNSWQEIATLAEI